MTVRTLHLTFDDGGPLDGHKVTARGLTVDEWLGPDRDWRSDMDMFAERLESWDLTGGDGEALPPDREGVGCLDASTARYLVVTWMREATAMPAPLARQRTTPPPSFDESGLPMSAPDSGSTG